MKITIYQYPQCGTCRDAIKSLKAKGHEVDSIHIVDNPPSVESLRELIGKSGLDLKKFFNVSGEVYKEMKLKDKLPIMSEDEMIALLASNGKLIKRPLVTNGNQVTVGFKEDEYKQVWS